MALTKQVEAPMGFGAQQGYAIISEVNTNLITKAVWVAFVVYSSEDVRRKAAAAYERIGELEVEAHKVAAVRSSPDAKPAERIKAERALLDLVGELEEQKAAVNEVLIPMRPPQQIMFPPAKTRGLFRKDGSVALKDLYPLLKEHCPFLADADDLV